MKVLLIGTGAIGSYYGGKLAIAGNDLWFTARGENLKAIESTGITAESINGDFNIKVRAAERFEHIPDLDLILVCVKTLHTDDILGQIKEQLSPDTVVISLQNGVDSESRLAEMVPAKSIIGGIAFIGANLVEPGKVKHTASGLITIGELDGKELDRTLAFKKLFDDAGIKCRIVDDIKKAKWEKLVWNAGFNGLAAITNMSVKPLLSHQPTRALVKNIMEEVVAVAQKLKIDIDPEMPDKQISVSDKMGDVTPSMLQDVRAGRKTEIDFINGKICAEGKRLGVKTPYNESVWAAVSLLDTATIKPK